MRLVTSCPSYYRSVGKPNSLRCNMRWKVHTSVSASGFAALLAESLRLSVQAPKIDQATPRILQQNQLSGRMCAVGKEHPLQTSHCLCEWHTRRRGVASD